MELGQDGVLTAELPRLWSYQSKRGLVPAIKYAVPGIPRNSVLSPDEIKAIRVAEHVSQPVFARYLNVSKNLVSDWERGAKKPGGPALRLLSIIQRSGLDAVA